MKLFFTHIKCKFQIAEGFLLIILIFIPFTAKSQPGKKIVDEPVYQQLIGRNYIDKSLVNKGIFFRNNFLPGKIVFASGDSINKVFIRYECLSEKLIWLSDAFGQIELDDLCITSFEFKNSDTTFLFKKMKMSALNDTVARFYQVYPNSRIGLTVLRKVARKDSYMKKKKFYIYAPAPVFVFSIQEKDYVVKSPKIKMLYALFPEKKEAIMKQLRGASFRISDSDDFIAFLQLIEPILLE